MKPNSLQSLFKLLLLFCLSGSALFATRDLAPLKKELSTLSTELKELYSLSIIVTDEVELLDLATSINRLECEEKYLKLFIKELEVQIAKEAFVDSLLQKDADREKIIKTFVSEFMGNKANLQSLTFALLTQMKTQMGFFTDVPSDDVLSLAKKILKNHFYSDFNYYSPVPYTNTHDTFHNRVQTETFCNLFTEILRKEIAKTVDLEKLIWRSNHYNIKIDGHEFDVPNDGLCLLRAALYLKLAQ